ncbi:MAG: hypothetical protein RR806_00890 [Oscillospiraceae bacterium]
MVCNRFKKETDNSRTIINFLMPILSIVLLILGLFWGVDNISQTTQKEKIKSLEQAIRRSAVHCYATQGEYPESIEYLQEHYGITYDSEKFLVDYQVFASNIMPEITIVEINKQ